MVLLTENSGIKCIKFSLISFTIILVITGISLIIVGSTINEIFIEFSYFLDQTICSPATLIMSIGFIIFGVACVGCLGAIKESVCIITSFGILLGITAFMQASSGMLNNMLMRDIDQETLKSLNNSMVKYTTDHDAKNAMDYLQRELHCCGLTGPKDWTMPTNFEVPKSCCVSYSLDQRCGNIFNFGCHSVLNSIVTESSRILTVSAYLLAFTQMFGMVFAFYLARMLREQKLAREYRRWAIRNQLLANIAYEPFYNYNSFYDYAEKNKMPSTP